ncbi:PspC domain-containing protein [Nannocystaceae bacterium ST9]
MTPRLYRSNDARMLLGVCGGIAQRLDLDPTLVRLAFVALFFFGPGILIYLIAALVIPRAPELPAGESMRVLRSDYSPPIGTPVVESRVDVVARDRSREPMRYGSY